MLSTVISPYSKEGGGSRARLWIDHCVLDLPRIEGCSLEPKSWVVDILMDRLVTHFRAMKQWRCRRFTVDQACPRVRVPSTMHYYRMGFCIKEDLIRFQAVGISGILRRVVLLEGVSG
jgi:hypothetical protein